MSKRREPRPPKPEGVAPNPRGRNTEQKITKPPKHTRTSLLQWVALFGKMERDSDRVVAIVGAALLENELALAIMTRLRPLSAKHQTKIFGDSSGALSDFYSKIQMGFALNLYNEAVMKDIDIIRNIRNRFAHNFEVNNFDDTEIASNLLRLKCPAHDAVCYGKEESTNPRNRFIDTIGHLGARFDRELSHIDRPRASTLISYDAPNA